MKPDPRFLHEDSQFWAAVAALTERMRYTRTLRGHITIPQYLLDAAKKEKKTITRDGW